MDSHPCLALSSHRQAAHHLCWFVRPHALTSAYTDVRVPGHVCVCACAMVCLCMFAWTCARARVCVCVCVQVMGINREPQDVKVFACDCEWVVRILYQRAHLSSISSMS